MASTSSFMEKNLLNNVMKGDWDKVKEIYKNSPDAHMAKITWHGYTALHLAVTSGNDEVVEGLVMQIRSTGTSGVIDDRAIKVLEIGSNRGQTALHFAAAMGKDKMCEYIAKDYPSLVGVRNTEGETPLFSAVLYGQKEAFLSLHRIICPQVNQVFDEAYSYCRGRGRGENILHCAIYGERFDFVNQVDKEGFSPLHTLATQPSCFKSGSNLTGWDKIIYKCTHVNEQGIVIDQDNRGHPENCRKIGHINLIRKNKAKHVWAVRVLDKILEHAKIYDNLDAGAAAETDWAHRDLKEIFELYDCENTKTENKKEGKKEKSAEEHKETAILIAAKNGISEIVDEILKRYPMAIHDTLPNMKNILLLAAEHRQVEVCKLLLRKYKDTILFGKVDNHRNSALHLAAKLRKEDHNKWPIPGAALQMQWEIKWYKFVKKFMPPHFFLRANKDGETPEEIFTKTHRDLIEKGSKWLTSTSTSCSVVATLIATVAFASSTTFPGGTDSGSGKPTLENQTSFGLFAASSLIALCFSVTALIMFLAILTSRCQEKDFGKNLPTKLLLGLTSLFVSIASMITSFCAGYSLVLRDKFKYLAFPVYAVTFLPVCLFVAAQFPLYLDLFRATFRTPFRSTTS